MGNFLEDQHTLDNYRNNWQPDLIDRKTRKGWEKQGSTTMVDRARKKIKTILSEKHTLTLSPDQLGEVERICGYYFQKS